MEREFLAWLADNVPSGEGIATGLGDDAAVLKIPSGQELVVTTDAIVEGSHFLQEQASPKQIGRKALAVNLSDLAAMAAKPLAAVATIALPKSLGPHAIVYAKSLTDGMLLLAEKYDCPLVGGDTVTGDHGLMVSVTALGTVEAGSAWLRSGAQPGDRILVTGELGGSLLDRHLTFEPRVREAWWLREHADIHAAMDISDGLALDLSRMAQASQLGVGVEPQRVPISTAARNMAEQGSGKTPLEHAMCDGEDFELLLAVPPADAERLIAEQPLSCRLSDIGEFTKETSLLARDSTGEMQRLEIRGYEHQ